MADRVNAAKFKVISKSEIETNVPSGDHRHGRMTTKSTLKSNLAFRVTR